jgi:hypothetical protein
MMSPSMMSCQAALRFATFSIVTNSVEEHRGPPDTGNVRLAAGNQRATEHHDGDGSEQM